MAESGDVATEQIADSAFGVLDATAPANALINDVLLAREPDGKVRPSPPLLSRDLRT